MSVATEGKILHLVEEPIHVLLLDDDPENLLLRAAILRKHGYVTDTAATIAEAEKLVHKIDIAVLDYHLGEGQFGTDVADILRGRRPEVPIIILSATLEHRFGGVEDMHLLKGYSSAEDLIAALRSFEAKHRGKPVVVDARASAAATGIGAGEECGEFRSGEGEDSAVMLLTVAAASVSRGRRWP